MAVGFQIQNADYRNMIVVFRSAFSKADSAAKEFLRTNAEPYTIQVKYSM